MPAPRPVASSGASTGSAPSAEWLAGPPDYVGVGVGRSVTSWWHDLIGQHPQVARVPGRPQGLHFFDDRWDGGLDEAAITRYRALFPRPPGAVAGEWTPDYLQQPWTPALLRRAAPDARLLVMLRDPVACFASEFASATHGADALSDRIADRAPTPRAAANAAFSRGLYADQLLRLWQAFPREQVLVLQYERCLVEPEERLARTFAFIGLPRTAASIDPGRREGAATIEHPLSAWQIEQLTRQYASENRRLAALLPDLDLSLWRAPG